jgi:hypothetical protein|tara:strand:- start:3766 stop:3966 length:201 start_codon:yes stop_codon:yes gene_type:complete
MFRFVLRCTVQRFDFSMSKFSVLTNLKPSITQRTNLDSPQPDNRVADSLTHLPHLPVAAFVNRDRN